jgi:transcriptional regulator with XRE-family HTH domain
MTCSASSSCCFGPLLRELRMARGLSLIDLAATVKMSPTALAEFELGARMPSDDERELLLGCIKRRDDTTTDTWRRHSQISTNLLDAVKKACGKGPLRDEQYWAGVAATLAESALGMAQAGTALGHETRNRFAELARVLDALNDALIPVRKRSL